MENSLRLKIIIGSLVLFLVSVFIVWSQHRANTVVLGEIKGNDLSDIDLDLEVDELLDYDENTPLVLNESGEMVPARRPRLTGVTFDTVYTCPSGENFLTQYDIGANALVLVLPNEETYVLPQSVTTVGARYAKWDDSVVFYEEAGEASVEKGGTTILDACVGRVDL